MDERITNSLREGETLLWKSRAEAIETLDKTNKKRFWITTAICAVLAVILSALYVIYVKGPVKPAVLVILVLLCAFAPLRRLLDASAVRKLGYAVTNQRLLIVSGEVKGVSLSRVKEAALRTDEDGHLSLLVGADALKAKPSHWRDVALTGLPGTEEEGTVVEYFGFYAVEDKSGLRKILRQVLPLVKS